MDAFYALEPRWFTRNRFYKVYVTRHDLRGAWLGGQIYDEASAQTVAASTQYLAPLAVLWAGRVLRRVRQRERDYDDIAPCSEAFLRFDRRNFLIFQSDIVRVTGDRKRSYIWDSGNNVGNIRVHLRNGSARRWIITANQNLDAIAALLGYHLEP